VKATEQRSGVCRKRSRWPWASHPYVDGAEGADVFAKARVVLGARRSIACCASTGRAYVGGTTRLSPGQSHRSARWKVVDIRTA
jgi:hypothetical protein